MQFTGLLFAAALLVAGEPDTLDVATVTAEKGVTVSSKKTIIINDHENVTDALMRIPGIQISDMGGSAGLKTVSLRGLGSAHTSVYIDGIKVSNLQSGQQDLGIIGLEDIASVVIDYAQNSLDFKTSEPEFHGNERLGGRVSFAGGSFGTYDPSLRLDCKISDRLTLSANASAVLSKGDFPYIGTGEDGTTVIFKRTGNDIRQYKGGLNAYGKMSNGSWNAKAFFNSTERGTPGSVSWPSEDRQKDMNGFLQGSLWKRISSLYTLRASAKVSYDDLLYKSSWGDSRYVQKEIQINTSHAFNINEWWKMTGAVGGQWDGLESGNYIYPSSTAGNLIQRYGLIAAAGSSFLFKRVKADIALEYSGSYDMVPGADKKIGRNVLSPSASLQVKIIKSLKFNAFGRRAYRTPMFNELYYVGYGNENLKSEDAWISGLGAEWSGNSGKAWSFTAKADLFCNWLRNKITSAPSLEDQNIWLPYNIGKVLSKGFDISAGAGYSADGWSAGANASYTLQEATDKTPESYTFGQQIPYVARHSVTTGTFCGYQGWKLGMAWNLRAGRSDSSGEMPDWNTLDATISKTFRFGKDRSRTLDISIIGRNLTDTRFELSRGYPMPGRSIMGGFTMEF